MVLVLMMGAFVGPAAEKETSGGLTVIVSDEVGPLPGATVTISNTQGFVKTTSVQTNVRGRAEFPVLRPGSGYRIGVSLANFGTQVVDEIRIRAGETLEIPVVLAQEMVETVRVVASKKRLRKSSQFSEEFVQDLPVPGRFYQNVLTLAPGVVDADGDGNSNVHGSRDRVFKDKRRYSRFNTEAYGGIRENGFRPVFGAPLSTFSIDVDTASYSNVRRFLDQGVAPPPGAVRIEELINYFDYDYVQPDGNVPFGIDVEISEAPWNPKHRLARIGLKGKELRASERPACNLVFLVDVSGSMNTRGKPPLVKRALRMLVPQLRPQDRIAIVVYAGASGLALPSTPGDRQEEILDAIERLSAGGSTNGGEGIELAYRVAREGFVEGGLNRVILATDGDFNVGLTDQGSLVGLVEEKAKSGVFLTVLGFGMGNFKDSTLEKLADKGNGNYAYIDTLSEARKVLVEQIGGTLVTIAKDVKFQIEFNPAEVTAYRLIGYENRMLAAQDFNDDTKDAGEIGAGHTVTAFYEIVPVGVEPDLPDVDPLKYQAFAGEPSEAAETGELMTVKLRYKQPDGDTSSLIEIPVVDLAWTLDDASDDFVFAASVASFGMLLRGSEHRGAFTYDDVLEMAESAMRDDSLGYRSEFVDLVYRAIEVDN